MFVIQMPETIRQTEAARSEDDADAVRKPLSEEKNTGLAVVPDVSADIEELVSRDRFQEPFRQDSAEARSHPHERKSDDADERLSVAKIEFEWNLPLQDGRISGIVDKDRAIPTSEKQRLGEF